MSLFQSLYIQGNKKQIDQAICFYFPKMSRAWVLHAGHGPKFEIRDREWSSSQFLKHAFIEMKIS